MPKPKFYINTRNLFNDDDDEEESQTKFNGHRERIPPPKPKIKKIETENQNILKKQEEIKQRTIESTIRSIVLLNETEECGIVTAKELVHQHEKLQNINRNLDVMDTNLNHNQKNINGIKSVFYGFKQRIFGKSSPKSCEGQVPSSTTGLKDTISKINETDNFESHPTTRSKDLNEQATVQTINSQDVHKILDNNLEVISSHVSRLKVLGTTFGQEIEEQNKLIDKITVKVDNADIKIGHQNKQINTILGKNT